MTGAWRWLRLALGLVLLAGLIAWLGPREVLAQLEEADPAWLLLAVTAIAASTLIAAYALFLLVNRDSELPFRRFIGLYWVSWAFGLVAPGQVGDLATLTILMQRRGLRWPAGLGRMLLDKLVTLVVLGAFAIAGIRVWLPKLTIPPALTAALLAGVFAIIVVAWLVVRRPRRGAELRSALAEMGATAARFPGRVAANLGLTVLKLGGIVFAYWCVFRALGEAQLGYASAIPLVAASALVAYVPVSFNGIGTVEYAGIVLFGSAGIASAAVLSAYLLLRVMVMAIAWLPLSATLLAHRPSARQDFSSNP